MRAKTKLHIRVAELAEELYVISKEEKEWALLADNDAVPITVSVTLLEALHTRWSAVSASITDEQWNRTVVHPLAQVFRRMTCVY